jgi:hypothetical protein
MERSRWAVPAIIAGLGAGYWALGLKVDAAALPQAVVYQKTLSLQLTDAEKADLIAYLKSL